MPTTNKYILAKHNKKRLNEYFNDIREHTADKEPFQDEQLKQPDQKRNDTEERSYFKAELNRLLKQRNAHLSIMSGND